MPPILLGMVVVPYLIMFAISAALSAAAYFLLQGQMDNGTRSKLADFTPTTLCSQGAYVPLVVGRQRVGCVVAGAWDRFTRTAPSGQRAGKGSRKKKRADGQVYYYEGAWHLICVGPAWCLRAIYADGKRIYNLNDDPGLYLYSDTTPSGTVIDLDNGVDQLAIYWGGVDQPVNDSLEEAHRIGVRSKWPHHCYVQWLVKFLGPSPRWPQIEYDIEVKVYNVRMDDLYGISVAEDYIDAVDYDGVNAASAMAQIMFETFPHGVALDPSHFSIGEDVEGSFVDGSLADLIQAMADEEHATGFVAADGMEVTAVIAGLMQDMGVLIFRDYSNLGLNSWRLVREEPEPLNEIPAGMILPPDAEIETLLLERPVDRIMIEFPDATRQFRKSVISIAEDGQSLQSDNVRGSTIPLFGVIDPGVATKVAQRRSQEELAGAVRYKINVGRNARYLKPGQAVFVEGFTQVLRVMNMTFAQSSLRTSMDLVQDYYGSPAVDYTDVTQPNLPGDSSDPLDNLEVAFFELPADLVEGNVPMVVPLRIRDNTQAYAQEVHLSSDGATYELVDGDTFVHTGGLLTSALVLDTDYNLATGPTLDIEGDDVADVVEDFTSDARSWRDGRQVVLIGEELIFVQKVTALGGVSYRLDGCLRARYDTQRALHAIGTKVIIFPMAAVNPIADPVIVPGGTVYMKQQSLFNGGAWPLVSTDVESKVVKAKGLVPSRPAAFRVTAPFLKVPTYYTGNDVSFRWAYRSNTFQGTGAGQQRSNNNGVGSSPVQGEFELKVYDPGLVLVRTELVSVAEWTYTNADLASDLGGETNFSIELRNVNGGWKSDPLTLSITKQ